MYALRDRAPDLRCTSHAAGLVPFFFLAFNEFVSRLIVAPAGVATSLVSFSPVTKLVHVAPSVFPPFPPTTPSKEKHPASNT